MDTACDRPATTQPRHSSDDTTISLAASRWVPYQTFSLASVHGVRMPIQKLRRTLPITLPIRSMNTAIPPIMARATSTLPATAAHSVTTLM